jgi:hypothetical protein
LVDFLVSSENVQKNYPRTSDRKVSELLLFKATDDK